MALQLIYSPIGVAHTPFDHPAGMPIQPTGESSASGAVEIFPEFTDGLTDIDGFSHLILIYHFHKAGPLQLMTAPFLDSESHGIFATRAPSRPNPIGVSVVRLIGIEGRELRFSNLDVMDGTPVLDLKPYVPEFDAPHDCHIGWLKSSIGRVRDAKSDDRFTS